MKKRSPIFLLAASVLLIAVSCGGSSEPVAEEPIADASSTEDPDTQSESPAEADDESLDSGENDGGSSDAATTTTTEAPKTETAPGSDPKGDPLDGLDNPTDEADVAGGDIENVRHVLTASGENCFIIDFYGDGETTSAEVGTYIVDVEVADSGDGGFGVRTEFKRGEAADGSVRLGLLASGRDRLEGAVVTLVWDDSDTLSTCVDSGETSLDVETFEVSIYIFSADGDYWDRATGVGAS